MKILNLYAGIGGNRKLWGGEHKIIAVENNKEIAKIYQDFFPNDKVIITDAHKYLLENYKEFDFIWSSPPCPSHSITNFFLNAQGYIRYPDMKMYEEIIFLQTFSKCKWVIENVRSYYKPLIKPQLIGRHYFWSNFHISKIKDNGFIGTFNRNSSLLKQSNTIKRQTERNMVNPKIGLHVFKMAFKHKQEVLQ